MGKAKTKAGVIFILSVIVIMVSAFALAKPGKEDVSSTNTKSGNIVEIPSNAIQVADNVFSLGMAKDADGSLVEGYAIIHKKDSNAKPTGTGGKNRVSACYGFLSSGAKWKNLEPWVVNPANSGGLSDSFIFSNVAADIQKWEDASLTNILGDGSVTPNALVADTTSPDNVNEVYFGNVDSAGAIAVTIVWGIFSGPPSQRKLVEWDQVYDQVDFDWSAIGESNKMDFENIATHELGHSVGMADLYNLGCSQETMYGYASNGEIIKRDLNAGDIAGIRKLYN